METLKRTHNTGTDENTTTRTTGLWCSEVDEDLAGHQYTRQIIELSGQERGSYSSASQIAWRFGIEELNLATKNFCDINLIGHGTFGEAYKGLLQDGTIVAIKRRKAPTNQYFTDEVLMCLDHLHGLDSPMVHMNFKTANVLVDEDFIPKVADAGIRSLLYRIDGAAPSRMTIIDPFLDPE
ncbi:Calmodulin-binding receptor-like cytoplasmic kinase 1 [Apostasia shenzhenica]|uniref:non-specific serine/threonine protein kinase n=1 Tax=Apostasia shenzhenica TaxID=1088818 RepID=A0A2I0AGZ7_9ASPA|nr:Calmodulin-binding receptor-like cytoplasmic kinase 1 [Apostasia shenzhenica]